MIQNVAQKKTFLKISININLSGGLTKTEQTINNSHFYLTELN